MHRDIFQHRIYKGLIGPGSDSFGLPDEEEIISDYPLQRYFSAVLFPEKNFSATEEEDDATTLQSETEESNSLPMEKISVENGNDKPEEFKKGENTSEDESKVNQNHFNPNN